MGYERKQSNSVRQPGGCLEGAALGAVAWTGLKTVGNEEAVVGRVAGRVAGRCADEAALFLRAHNQARAELWQSTAYDGFRPCF